MQGNTNFFYLSNIALVLPVLAAWYMGEWFYLFLALGCLTFSLLFHFEHRPQLRLLRYFAKYRKNIYFRVLDWTFAVASFIYMFIYVALSPHEEYRETFYFLLTFSLLTFILSFFFFKRKYYHAVHPYFHIVAGLTATAIVLLM